MDFFGYFVQPNTLLALTLALLLMVALTQLQYRRLQKTLAEKALKNLDLFFKLAKLSIEHCRVERIRVKGKEYVSLPQFLVIGSNRFIFKRTVYCPITDTAYYYIEDTDLIDFDKPITDDFTVKMRYEFIQNNKSVDVIVNEFVSQLEPITA